MLKLFIYFRLYHSLLWLLSLCVLNACATSLSVNKADTSLGFHEKYTEIAFPNVLPAKGRYNFRAKVHSISQCPQNTQCLVADHLNIITTNSSRFDAQSHALIVYATNVSKFQKGHVYLFSFVDGRLLGAKALVQ